MSDTAREANRSTKLDRRRWALAATLVLALVAGGAEAIADPPVEDDTTLERTIVEGDEVGDGFSELKEGPGQDLVVREDLANGASNREDTRESLVYLAQLTDFQLADEESPSRVEFADAGASSAWRPQEAFHPFAIDLSMRLLNRLSKSPIPEGDGDRADMKLAVLTGDQADNQQFNETMWVRQLIEPNSNLHPGSGVDQYQSGTCDAAAAALVASRGYDNEGAASTNYIGVQDYDEFDDNADYYDPEDPKGDYANWPRYTGLMNRAQSPFVTSGLKVPSYVVNGNHDTLIQGNEDANQLFERIATGCLKPTATTSGADPGDAEAPNPDLLLDALPAGLVPVPPDPDRRFVSKGEIRQIFSDGSQNDDHGFKYVDSDEDDRGAGLSRSIWYYAWNPKPGLRFLMIDTVSEGGVVQESSEGNVDDSQYQWIEDELEKARDRDELVVVFGHHPIRSLKTQVPDEAALPCLGGYDGDGDYVGTDREPAAPLGQGHNHALNPGCDPDNRKSTPIHLGDSGSESVKELFERFDNVVAYVPGHTHENEVQPCGGSCADNDDEGEGDFWELNTSAIADWPQQSRLVDVMDNRDGTLSIFSVVTDHDSFVDLPSPGSADNFGRQKLGALGRTFAFNDPQLKGATNDAARGDDEDRNVELLLEDPRDSASVRGTKFFDADADGTRDAGEPGVAGFTLFVDYDDDGELDDAEPRDVSEDDGGYEIRNVDATTFKVREVEQAGVVCTTPQPCEYEEEIDAGETITGRDFGNFAQSGGGGGGAGDDCECKGKERKNGKCKKPKDRKTRKKCRKKQDNDLRVTARVAPAPAPAPAGTASPFGRGLAGRAQPSL